MNQNQNTISAAEAKSTLEALNKLERDANNAVRPPLWLNFIASISYGMITFSFAAARDENLWVPGLPVSALVFFMSTGLYLYRCHLIGVKPKLMPRNMSEVKFQLLLGIIFTVIIVLTKILANNDFWWASYTGGAINALILGYSLHNFSTGEFVSKGSDDE